MRKVIVISRMNVNFMRRIWKKEENLYDYWCPVSISVFISNIYIYFFYVGSIGWLIDRFPTRALENTRRK